MNIEDSLRTIVTLATKIRMLYRQFTHLKTSLTPLGNIRISDHLAPVSLNQSLIATTNELMFLISESIIDEYHEILTPVNFPKNQDQILKLKKDIKPAMKRLNKWSQRKMYRNTLVAHNLRFKDKTSVFEKDEKIQINAPHYDNDFVIIYYIHIYMTHCLGKHFGAELFQLDTTKVIDKIDFTGELTSLKDELPFIQSWALERGIEIEELNGHIEFLEND